MVTCSDWVLWSQEAHQADQPSPSPLKHPTDHRVVTVAKYSPPYYVQKAVDLKASAAVEYEKKNDNDVCYSANSNKPGLQGTTNHIPTQLDSYSINNLTYISDRVQSCISKWLFLLCLAIGSYNNCYRHKKKEKKRNNCFVTLGELSPIIAEPS